MPDTRTVPDRPTPADLILETAAGWPGVTTRITPRGATAIVLADKELGHADDADVADGLEMLRASYDQQRDV